MKTDNPLERFSRTIDLIGLDGFQALRRSRVAVLGLGGVGSHAAVALARAGIGALRLVDHDPVHESNLNRHAVATPKDVGRLKVDVVAGYLGEATPDTEIETSTLVCCADSATKILSDSLDYAIDAIDGLNAKVSLLAHCVQRGLKVVSSMGAAARTDPSLLRISDIEESRGCPLAKVVRKRLHRRNVRGGIVAVYSIERKGPVLPPDEPDDGVRCRPRNRLPSLSTLPGMFGYAAANVVIARISGLVQEPEARD